MHVVMVTVGTRGDVQPFVALGKGLARGGYRVTIATHEDYESFVTEHGLGFRPVGGSFKKLVESDLGREWIESSDSLRRYLDTSRRVFEPIMPIWRRDAHDAVADADAVIFHALTTGAADHAEKRSVPRICVMLVPSWPSGDHSMFFPRAPWRWLRRWLSEQALRGMCKLGRGAYDDYRRELGLPLARQPNMWRDMVDDGIHFLCLYSRHIGHAPSEWPDTFHVTGSCVLDTTSDWTPPKNLVDFVGAGPPPIYVGFGSMTGRSPEDLARLALEATERAKQRAIIVTGWGGVAQERQRDDVLVLDNVPHEWLFPRCSAVVHHGGAGTVMAGLMAGKPTVVTPFFGDQPYWGYRVHELGAGPPPIMRRNLDAARLANAITEATSEDRYRQGAEHVAAALRTEDGTKNAVETIRTILGSPEVR